MIFDITRTFVFVWVCSGIVVSLEQGEIVIKDESSSDLSKFRISDGRFHLEAYVSKGKLSSCTLTQDSKEIDTLLNSHAEIENIGEYAIQEMFDRCIRHMASKPKRAGEDNESSMPFSPEKTGQPAGPGASGIGIFPGTKWCGLGNEADTYADLGKFKETDACCRAHDQCPYFIDHFETKYNYHNPYPWTLSHCDCDNKLYSCLKSVNTTASNEVGKLFFGVLSVDCFTFNEGKYCQKEHWSHLFCEKYTSGQ
nr:uncharacterized protein LOC111136645 isoform X2 [Crassostrea virginica]